ncbi:hypothetical protein L916_14649, partial [Phytophthora nicotianae]
CAFVGYGIAKAMSDTSTFRLVLALEEYIYIYERFKTAVVIQHDRDLRVMSEGFKHLRR